MTDQFLDFGGRFLIALLFDDFTLSFAIGSKRGELSNQKPKNAVKTP